MIFQVTSVATDKILLMNLKYENLQYIDLGASPRKFNDVIENRKQGSMPFNALNNLQNRPR